MTSTWKETLSLVPWTWSDHERCHPKPNEDIERPLAIAECPNRLYLYEVQVDPT